MADGTPGPLLGRRVLVTGGGRGIGAAIVARLMADGAAVVLTYRRDLAAAQDLGATGALALDLAEPASVDAVVAEAAGILGGLDAVVSNAGIASSGRTVADTGLDELSRALAMHAVGPHRLCHAALPHLRAADRADIVFVSSVASHTPMAGGAPYVMGKLAVEGLAACLAREERANGVRVNVVAPGLVDTEMGRRLVRATTGITDIRELDAASPFGRVCAPEDVAEVVGFLLGPGGAYVNDQRIEIDGGDVLMAPVREFVPTAETVALRDTVRDHCARTWDEAAVRAVSEDGKAAPRAWRVLGEELGVLGLLVPERFGGAAAGVVEAAVVAEELGAVLAPVPYLSTAYATRLLLGANDEQACADLLPGLCDGSRTAAVAAGFTASGVVDGVAATDLLVVADGVLFHLDAAAVRRTPVSTLDLTRPQADIAADPAAARRIGPVDAGAARDVVLALLAAEQVGVARTMLDVAVAYAKERTQFGRPIGSFQAVKHRCADMLVELELARSVAAHAAWTLDHGGDDPALAASLAHVVTARAARAVTSGAMQVLGGVAITWEHRAHLYYKRAVASAALWGGRAHRARLARLAVDGDTADDTGNGPSTEE